MKVTRVIYGNRTLKSISDCSIILDDCLKIDGIRLYKNGKGYYLIFPSKQDVYEEVKMLNTFDIQFPDSNNRKKYEEFAYPLEKSFYTYLLDNIVKGYEAMKSTGRTVYRPE